MTNKMKTTSNSAHRITLKLIGGAGYLTWALQLLVLLALYFERFYHSNVGRVIFPTASNSGGEQPDPVATPSIALPTSGIFTWIVLFLGLALIGLVVYIVTMLYIPAINKTAKKAVKDIADHTVDQIERAGRKKLTKRKRRSMSARIVWWLKLIISITPLAIVLFVEGTPLISKEAALLVTGALGLWAVICFTAQKALAHVWRKTITDDEL